MLKFEKVSFEQFKSDCIRQGYCESLDYQKIYESIELPKRSTQGSAGYDFFTPFSFELSPNKSIFIPTGIRAKMPYGVVLILAPRSGQGIRFKLQLMNTIGVIDADYYEATNQGHIMVSLFNDHREGHVMNVEAGQAFCQGLFLPYYLTDDDHSNQSRTGGFGSTDQK